MTAAWEQEEIRGFVRPGIIFLFFRFHSNLFGQCSGFQKTEEWPSPLRVLILHVFSLLFVIVSLNCLLNALRSVFRCHLTIGNGILRIEQYIRNLCGECLVCDGEDAVFLRCL